MLQREALATDSALTISDCTDSYEHVAGTTQPTQSSKIRLHHYITIHAIKRHTDDITVNNS